MDIPLWEQPTLWFQRHRGDHVNSVFPYKSWKDFTECKPYKLWKPYILSSWCWKENMLQIVFISPDRFAGMHYAEIPVTKEDEPDIRAWLKSHMPSFWKI